MPIDGNGKWQNIRGRLKWVSAGHPYYIFGVNANDQIVRMYQTLVMDVGKIYQVV